jgi:CBS domain containing-hemolysin-like protein
MIPLLLALFCVVANAFFVATEFAFVKVRPASLAADARAGDASAARALAMTKKLDSYLSSMQLGITLASLGLGWLGEPALADLIHPPLSAIGASEAVVHGIAYAIAFGIITLFHIVLGEQVPKLFAIRYPVVVSRVTAAPMMAFFAITWPAMWVLDALSAVVLRLLRVPPDMKGEGKLSPDEIRVIIQASFSHEGERDRKRDLLERVLRGTDRPARAVMVPRVDMVVLSTTDDVDSCLEMVKKHGYSRYPLCQDGNPDRVIGYVHVKDLLTAAAEASATLTPVKRDVLFVPETTSAGDLLSEFQLTGTPIAIVVDEYGGTDGLVTVEDVVEEMVGEIQDEHDSERPRVVTHEDGSISVDGAVVLGEVGLDGLALDEEKEDQLVSAYVVEALGHLARQGDRIRCGAWDITVEVVRRRRVNRVRFTRRPESIKPEEPEES